MKHKVNKELCKALDSAIEEFTLEGVLDIMKDFDKWKYECEPLNDISTYQLAKYIIEGYEYPNNERELFIPENKINDFESIEQVKQFVKDHYYSDTKLMFNYDDLKFPNTYVFVESEYENIENNGEDDVWLRERTKLDIYTLDGFKETILRSVNEFK